MKSNPSNELLENTDMESFAVDPPIRTIRRRIHGSPSITRFTVVRAYRDRFEINLPDTDATITVARNPGENARSALRRYLTQP